MRNWKKQIVLALLFSLLLSGCSAFSGAAKKGKALDSTMPAVIRGKEFCLRYQDGSSETVFLNGVNMGAATVGNFPGDFTIPKETYLRWFKYISDLNVQVIRVYVSQMPGFYDALAEYNAKAKRPLYLIHGVFCNEDMMLEYANAYGGGGAFRSLFLSDICTAVDIIHGNAETEKMPGIAGGHYVSDVSPWVIGWILGVEWTADFVNGTNLACPEKTAYEGTYVRTEDASPFEVFLAEAAETAISREMEIYETQRPVALCNWCTTDPLDHPNEPFPGIEDAVSFEPEHIRATDAFKAGFFASYHVYPYYPEFLSYDTKYVNGYDPDPYLAYLQELNAHHSMPVLIAEYGIPSSRGISHINDVTGMAQGQATEKQQGEWIIRLNRDIRQAGCAGALIFSWQDEWFKQTWNSYAYELSERTPFWYNPQSPEECFGLLAFTTGSNVIIDGKNKDWKGIEPVVENEGITVYAQSDAGYLYLLVKAPGADLENDEIDIPLSVASGLGSSRGEGLSFSDDAEFLLRLHGRKDTRLLTDAYYDAFYFTYAHSQSYFPVREGQYEKGSGRFGPVWMALNMPMKMPETGEVTEFVRFETGLLRYGITDPNDPAYDSRADFRFGDGFAEIRLPWMLIGFMDPSSKLVIGDLYENNAIVPLSTDGVKIGVCRAGSTETVPMNRYTWDNWGQPEAKERLKASYFLLRDYFAEN